MEKKQDTQRNMPGRTIRWIVFVFALGMLTPLALASESGRDMETVLSVQDAIKEVTERVAPAVVSIEVTPISQVDKFEELFEELEKMEKLPKKLREFLKKFEDKLPPLFKKQTSASGVIISSDGHIFTNDHVVRNAKELKVTLETGKKYSARLVNFDPLRNLAVIKIEAENLPAAKLGNAEEVSRGMFVLALGSLPKPNGQRHASVSFGIVSATGRLIQTDATIGPSNSGGPLCNLKGEVIGINTAAVVTTIIIGGGSLGFAIPINRENMDVIDKLLRGEEIAYGYLGVVIGTPTEKEAKIAKVPPNQGAFVRKVMAGSPADKAGLMPGDVITEFNFLALESANELVRFVCATPAGREVSLTYVRKGKEHTTEVVIAKRPRQV